ncbi:MAG: ABC transporter ATP-binding protein [Bacteroidia bacterium]|nr:ABC transporter ATP-binding protein [Bacteroidia bacterium]
MKYIVRVFSFVRNYKKYAALNILFNILFAVFSLFSLTLLKPFLDVLFYANEEQYRTILEKGDPGFSLSASGVVDAFNYHITRLVTEEGKLQALIFICVFVLVMIFFKNLCRYMAMFYLAPIRNGVVKDLRNEVFSKILVLPLSFFSNERKGDIMSRMNNDVKEVEWSVMNSLEMLFREPINIAFFLIWLIWISPWLTLFAFVLLPLMGILIGRVSKTLRRTTAREKEMAGTLLSVIEETLSGLRIIKAFNHEKKTDDQFQEYNRTYTQYMVSIYRRVDLAGPLSEFLGVLVLVLIMYFGGVLVLGTQPTLEASSFIAYIAVFSQLIGPAKSLTTAYFNIQKGVASLERIRKITEADVTIRDPEKPLNLNSFEKEVQYRNVSFSYTRGDSGYVLHNVNLTIPKGKTVALVGQSGSGKSTLADMLPRFYDPGEGQGSVIIDGMDLRDCRLRDIRKLMGIVTQESILFNDTVFNNIAFGMEGVSQEQVQKAAEIANAHEFISRMPEGYNTNIGDRGSKLSGGQRQRISIARAVLKNPPILILDEATSALDTESERLVQDALGKLMRNRTTLVIAHRLSTIQHADEIVVLEKGEIRERGTHQELLGKNGIYRRLYDMQSFV